MRQYIGSSLVSARPKSRKNNSLASMAKTEDEKQAPQTVDKLGNHGKGNVAKVIHDDGNVKRVIEFTERDYPDGTYIEAARQHYARMKASPHLRGTLSLQE